MNDDLPTQMPDQPPPLPPPPTTKVPRVFSIWGTICYGIAAVYSCTTVMLIGIIRWMPPWYIVSSAFMYVFISAGIICFGRIEANRDARFFIQALRKRSDENKQRRMREMN
jgi:hypothetical protein